MTVSPNEWPKPDRPYRVLVVDDSPVARAALCRVLGELDEAVVTGAAADGREAIQAVARAALTDEPVEIVLLDIEMPVMDGLTALAELLAVRPPPKVIMSSVLTHRGAAASLRAMMSGASDFICKPRSTAGLYGESLEQELAAKIACWGAAARQRPGNGSAASGSAKPIGTGPEPSPRVDAPAPPAPNAGSAASSRAVAAAVEEADGSGTHRPTRERKPARTVDRTAPSVAGGPIRALAIGGSTGAPQALMRIFGELRGQLRCPVFVTQHMPVGFTAILAEQLARVSGHPCREGEHGERVADGRIYVAPGDHHLMVRQQGPDIVLELSKAPPENFCRPAVDPMLRSLASAYGGALVTVILTGMGQDGLKGCAAVKEAGGQVIVQDQPSSVVWGMPGAVARHGLADRELPLDRIAAAVARGCRI